MRKTVNLTDFQDAFKSSRPDNFTYEGLQALFEYFEDYEESTGDEMEFDVIAICCDFAQYTIEELQTEYNHMANDSLLLDCLDEWVELLSEHTQVIRVTNTSLIIQEF